MKIAIDTGYRHIDGAYLYQNEHEVGEAIREKIAEGKVRREDIFYCGKVSLPFTYTVSLMSLFPAEETHQATSLWDLSFPHPLQWKYRVLTTGPSGVSQRVSSELANSSILPRI